MDSAERVAPIVLNTRGRVSRREGRKVTINTKLFKKRARGERLDISFPRPFGKVCGKHAKLFKSEVTVIVRNNVPLQDKKWMTIDKEHPGTMSAVWKKLKDAFPEIHDEDKDYAMKQVEEQYNNRRYRIHCLHREKKPRPTHVSPEDWAWLIKHVWSNEDFQKRSNQNAANRAKQEMGSKVGTKSIAQIAYELRNRETGEWPTAMLVWRATYQKADGTWSVPNGAEILAELNEVAQSQHEKISSAPVPLVEHFALVLGRKVNHFRGVGFRAINAVAEERLRFLAQVDAAEKRAAAAQERADAAEQRAVAMEDQVRKLDEANARLEEEQQSQRDELNSQKKTVEGQVTDVERMVQLKLDEQVARYFSHLASSNGVPFSQASSDAANNQDHANAGN